MGKCMSRLTVINPHDTIDRVKEKKTLMMSQLLSCQKIEYMRLCQQIEDKELDGRLDDFNDNDKPIHENLKAMKNWSTSTPGHLSYAKTGDNFYLFWKNNNRINIVKQLELLGYGTRGAVYDVVNLWTHKHYALKIRHDKSYQCDRNKTVEGSADSSFARSHQLVMRAKSVGTCQVHLYGNSFFGTAHYYERSEIYFCSLLEKLKGRLDDIAEKEKFSTEKKVDIIFSGFKIISDFRKKKLFHGEITYWNLGLNFKNELIVFDYDSMKNVEAVEQENQNYDDPMQLFYHILYSFTVRRIAKHLPTNTHMNSRTDGIISTGIRSRLLCSSDRDFQKEFLTAKRARQNIFLGEFPLFPNIEEYDTQQIRKKLACLIDAIDNLADYHINAVKQEIYNSLLKKIKDINYRARRHYVSMYSSFNRFETKHRANLGTTLLDIKAILNHPDGMAALHKIESDRNDYHSHLLPFKANLSKFGSSEITNTIQHILKKTTSMEGTQLVDIKLTA